MTSTAMIDLKTRLQEELDETLAEIARLDERLGRKGDYGLGKGDPSIYEWEMCLALKQRAENKARSLEVALRKAEEGDYGICEVCGTQIDPARLAILPHTKRCINCAQKAK
jgi:RNA polymerase-binding transcription factor DksA